MVWIVGIGMDGVRTLTAEAREIIDSADILIGAERMLKPFENCGKIIFNEYLPDRITEFINSHSGSKIAVLMSGDCGFFSGAKKLSALTSDCRIISGISTPVYLCSKIGVSWENMKFISLHGKINNIAVNVIQNEYCFFLLGGEITPADICHKLHCYGLGDVQVYVGINLGYENERIICGKASEMTGIITDRLCAVIVYNRNCLKYIPSGIRDEKFIRDKIPMTKAEIRTIVVSRLNISADSICWDIGCGTGSVSVEMAFRCPDGAVYGFDKNPDALKLTRINAEKFSCDNIHLHECLFPEDVPAEILVPDCVFIGGTAGKLHDIVSYIRNLNPYAEIVVTAVSIETISECLDFAGSEITQVAVSRTHKTGNYTMMSAENPVFIVRLGKCAE